MSDIEKTEAETAAVKAADVKADKKTDKDKKPSRKERLAKSLREYKSELKKIVWYSREQTVHSTLVVLVSIVASAALIAVFDFSFSHLISWLATLA